MPELTDPMLVELVARRDCEECDGKGARSAPEWRRFDEWADAEELLHRERGPKVEHYFLEIEGMSAVPVEEEPCPDCEATGKVEVLVDVPQLLDAFLDHVPQAVIPRGELEEMVELVKTTMRAAALESQGLADKHDAEGAATGLRVVTEGAEALRSLSDLLRPKA